MFKNRCLVYCILAVLVFYPLNLMPGESPDDINSNDLCRKLINEIIKNPSDDSVFNNAAALFKLAPYAGRKKIISVYEDAIKQLENKGDKENIISQVFRLLADDLEGGCARSIKNFSLITKWNVSEPWTKYGFPDNRYEYQPEKAVRIENIEKGKNFSTGEDGEIFPFRFFRSAGETAYLTCSFTCEEGINLWIVSDSKYRLFINGRELPENEISGEKEIKAFSLKGAKGYSIQIKIMAESGTHYPGFRAMITDEKSKPVKIEYSRRIFSYTYTPEKLYSLHESEKRDNSAAAVLTEEMNDFIMAGNYYAAYKLGAAIIEKYPSCAGVYGKYMHLLDIMNREDEYRKTLESFRKIFPESDIHLKWLAEFHMTRDAAEFSSIMQSMQLFHKLGKYTEPYIYMLCGDKKYSDALNFCSSLKNEPSMKHLIPRIIHESGDIESWRKALFRVISGSDDADYYYDLGLAEMITGIDPVMYWKKGLLTAKSPVMLRDLADIYENSIIKSNEYYTGIYTDFHPEFLWSSKKRKLSVYVFETGKIYFEGEDIIPAGNKLKKMKYNDCGLEFSGGEISTAVPDIKGLRVLYVLSAADGLASVINFNSEFYAGRGYAVKYKVSGKEEFSVVKYSGEYTGNNRNIFMLADDLILKLENEKMSDLQYEVIYRGDFFPLVNYKGTPLTHEKLNDGSIRFIAEEKFSDDNNNCISSDIFRFSSEREFTAWYSGIISSMGRNNKIKLNVSGDSSTINLIKKIHFQIMTRVSKNGDINFHPGRPDSVLMKGKGTVEERTLIAKIFFEEKGIKSFVSFIKNKKGLPGKILLYIPEKKGKGFWLDFYGENPVIDSETETEAIILTAEGYEKIPVSRDFYIR